MGAPGFAAAGAGVAGAAGGGVFGIAGGDALPVTDALAAAAPEELCADPEEKSPAKVAESIAVFVLIPSLVRTACGFFLPPWLPSNQE